MSRAGGLAQAAEADLAMALGTWGALPDVASVIANISFVFGHFAVLGSSFLFVFSPVFFFWVFVRGLQKQSYVKQ